MSVFLALFVDRGSTGRVVAAASEPHVRFFVPTLRRNAAVGVLLPPTAEVEERRSNGQGA